MVYQVFKNGNVLVASFDDFRKAQNRFRVIAKRGDYVEIWAYDPDSHVRKLLVYEN